VGTWRVLEVCRLCVSPDDHTALRRQWVSSNCAGDNEERAMNIDWDLELLSITVVVCIAMAVFFLGLVLVRLRDGGLFL
jgi:hypothetical protein